MSKLVKEVFDDVIVFSVSEPGAMGPNNMTFYTKAGEYFSVEHTDSDTYAELKEAYPVLKECFWNGPMKNEIASIFSIVIGGSLDDKKTTIPSGMRHIYLDYGNHVVVKEEYYRAVKDIFADKSKCDLTFHWAKFLKDAEFAGSRLDDIASAYYVQKERDEMITNKIKELNKKPEYREKIACSENNDDMMEVLKEYGIEIDSFELTQIVFRQSGLF